LVLLVPVELLELLVLRALLEPKVIREPEE
jgi:hypothetical protein